MKTLFALIFLLMAFPFCALADDLPTDHIEIKGIYVGMPKDQFKTIYKTYCQDFSLATCGVFHHTPFLTIGGTPVTIISDTDSIFITSIINRSDTSILLAFESGGFDAIRVAVASKYPQLTCTDSDWQNKMGAHFTQTICRVETANDELYLQRLADGNKNYGFLNLITTTEKLHRQRADLASKGDI